jgi:mannose-6-phosphate isomerase-like protein (cupin superfamily)
VGYGRQVHGEIRNMRQETRPWGTFEVLYETEAFWLKKIIIAPGQSLSYQYHRHRAEYWVAQSDGAWAELNGQTFPLVKDVAYTAAPCDHHRLYNPGQEPVSVLEWATGRPTEDDIIRLRDNYGRV